MELKEELLAMGKRYHTTIKKNCVKVSVYAPLSTDTVKILIQASLKNVRIEDDRVFDSSDHISQNINVYPDTGFRVCQDEDLQTLERSIQGALNEITDEVLEMREILMNHLPKSLKIYDNVIQKMAIGEYKQNLIDDMINLVGLLTEDFANDKVISSIKQIEIADKNVILHNEDIHENVIKLFNAIRTAIMVIDNK